MGRKQFESVVAQASREKLKIFSQVATLPLAAGQTEEILVFAGENTIAEGVGMQIDISASTIATSGDHHCYLGYKLPGGPPNIDLAYGGGAYNTRILYTNNEWEATSEKPSSVPQSVKQLNLKFDSVVPLRIFYRNSMNANSSDSRKYYLSYIEREVRS